MSFHRDRIGLPYDGCAYKVRLLGLSQGVQATVGRARKVCPHCGAEARRVGSDFKAPPLHDATGWELAAFLIRRGFPFYRLGVPFPTTMREAERFVMENSDRAVAE